MKSAVPPLHESIRWLQSPRQVALATATLAALVYVGALANGFAYDDNILILGDPGLRQLSGLLERLAEPSWPAAFGDEIGAWRPITTAVWAATWIVSEGSPVVFHALALILHAAVTGLGVLFFAELMPLRIAAAAGVLFAVHPVHVEAIANVAGSAEPLSALFVLVAALIHVRGGRVYGLARVGGVTLAYACAVLAKEGAAVFPLLLLLLDGARDDTRVDEIVTYIRERGVLYLSLTVALLLILIARMDVIGAVAAASYPPGAEILREAPRSWTVFSTWPHYVRLLFLPFDLAADYGPAVVPVVFTWTLEAMLGAFLGLASFGGAWLLWRRGAPLHPETCSERLPAFAILWMPAALLPVANVFYLGPVLVAERTLYLASWGVAVLGGWMLVTLAERRGPRAVWLLGVLVVAGAARTVTQVPVWNDTESVMNALIENHPESGTAWMNLGRQLAAQGREEDALTAFKYAVGFLNSGYRPSTEVAAHLMAMNRPAAARFFLMRAWREHPEWYTAPGLLAAAELNAGRPAKAAPAARAAALLQPANPSMHHLLAQSLAELEDWDGAVDARLRSLQAGFSDRGRSWLLLANEQASRGDTVAALAALDSASTRDLTDGELVTLAGLRDIFGPPSSEPRE